MLSKEQFEKYLESIGGLKSAYKKDYLIKSRYFFEVSEGWLELVKNCIEELINAGWNKEIEQVKEKFGTLRFYIPNQTNEMRNIIQKYIDLSSKTCEMCGKKGKIVEINNWLTCLCEKHEKLRKEKL